MIENKILKKLKIRFVYLKKIKWMFALGFTKK